MRAPGGWPRRSPRAASAPGDTVSVDARQHAADARGALRRADDRRRAAFDQHAPRCGDRRLPARPRRRQGRDLRPRVRARHERGAGASEGAAARHRLRRPAVPAAGRRRCPRSTTRRSSPRRSGLPLAHAARTSGRRSRSTTPRARPAIPKGVVYHHRGAHLMCYANLVAAGMGKHPVYLWTLPMFHCNGWCFPWTLSVVAGTHVCLRWVRAERHVRRDRRAQGDAPVRRADRHVDAARRQAGGDARRCRTRWSSSPPPRRRPRPCSPPWPKAGFNVTHVYGLTEVYGPAVVNEWHGAWDALAGDRQAALKARQGVRYPALEDLTVMDPKTMTPVAGRRRDAGRGHVPRQHRHEGLPQEPRGHRGGLRRRLVPFRRPRRAAPRRLHPAQGPLQGHHHLRRREHLLHRGRGRALQARRGGGLRRGRQGRREMGRDAGRLRRAEARAPSATADGDHRLVPRRTSPATSAPATSCSARSPRPAPARSRSSCCASGRRGFEGRCDVAIGHPGACRRDPAIRRAPERS